MSNQNFASELHAKQNAKEILKFAVEKLLKWSPEEMLQRFDGSVIQKMKLQDILTYIPFPVELDRNTDYYYYAYYLYPKKVVFDTKQSVIYTYRKILASYLLKDKKKNFDTIQNSVLKEKLLQDKEYADMVRKGCFLYKFPKEYLNENDGAVRAGICLQYAIKEFYQFKQIPELYAMFANKSQAQKKLEEHKLGTVCSDFFSSPLEYLHQSLPESQKDDLLYSYLQFFQKIFPDNC